VATAEEMRETRRVMNKVWEKRQFMEAGNHAATAVLALIQGDSREANATTRVCAMRYAGFGCCLSVRLK
jgi:hypothetical protein